MLKGTLDDLTLPDILRFLASSQKTGCIEVTRAEGDGRVFLRDGHCYHGESSRTRAVDVLGDQLAARRQIEDSVFDLLRWHLGEFTYSPGVEVDAGVAVAVPVDELLSDATRKLDELQVIASKIPNEEAIPLMAPAPPGDAAEINISPDEWRVLVLVTGTRSVSAIADVLGCDSFSVMRTLYGLATTGLIQVLADRPAEPEPEMDRVPDPADSTGESEADPYEVVDAYAAPLAAPLDGDALVDRMAAVKELADLFDRTESEDPRVGPPYPPELAAQADDPGLEDGVLGDDRRRVEDDEEITRGLISRLIDGVKGL